MNKYLKNHPHLFGKDDDPLAIIDDSQIIKKWENEKKKELLAKSLNPEWANIGVVLDDPYVIIMRDLVEYRNGRRNGFIRIYNRAYLANGAAGVVMLPELDKRILLIEKFRHATRSWHWEVPRGFGEAGVDADTQARAEIEEEVGGAVKETIDLGTYYCNTGLEGNPIQLFLVRLAAIDESKMEADTREFRWVTVPALETMIKNEKITDGFTIAAYTRAKLRGLI